jgi:Zn-dependent protease with chaperone function
MGISLSVILSPLLYAAALIVNDLVNLVVPTPDFFQAFVDRGGSEPSGETPVLLVVVVVLLIILPGALALILSWFGVRSLFRRAGAGGAILALGARDPAPRNLEEQQLVNVIAEMAIATGVPPPQVKLLDSRVPNAVAVGRSLDDATIVVTTGLLATLNRDETQGVIGHVVGSVGNGDLRIGMTIASLFQTLGMVSTFLRAPTEARSRKDLWRLIRFIFRRGYQGQEAAAVADMLAEAGESPDVGEDAEKHGTRIRDVITLPVFMAAAAFMMNDFIFMSFLINPLMRRAWAARQYLADATAVELTRNPQGLAKAVSTIGEGALPGARWAGHLFFAGPRQHHTPEPAVVGFHPPLGRRLERLIRMGAEVELPAERRRTRGQQAFLVAFVVLTSPLWIGFFLLMFGLALAITGISLMIDMLFLFPVVGVLHHFLRLAAK